MNKLEKQSNIISNSSEVVETISKDDLTTEQEKLLNIVIYKIQLIIMRYLQDELFPDVSINSNHSEIFKDWIFDNRNSLLKKISETGLEEIVKFSKNGEKVLSFPEADVAKNILDSILEDRELKEKLQKEKDDISFDNFDYDGIFNLLANEKPAWAERYKKAS